MRIPRMNQKPAIGIGIAAIVAVLCFAALASDSTRIEKPAAIDAERWLAAREEAGSPAQDQALIAQDHPVAGTVGAR